MGAWSPGGKHKDEVKQLEKEATLARMERWRQIVSEARKLMQDSDRHRSAVAGGHSERG